MTTFRLCTPTKGGSLASLAPVVQEQIASGGVRLHHRDLLDSTRASRSFTSTSVRRVPGSATRGRRPAPIRRHTARGLTPRYLAASATVRSLLALPGARSSLLSSGRAGLASARRGVAFVGGAAGTWVTSPRAAPV